MIFFQFTRQEFAEVIKIVGQEDLGKELSWVFTALPTIILCIIFLLWCIAFILVILLLPDNTSSKHINVSFFPTLRACTFIVRSKSYGPSYNITVYPVLFDIGSNSGLIINVYLMCLISFRYITSSSLCIFYTTIVYCHVLCFALAQN